MTLDDDPDLRIGTQKLRRLRETVAGVRADICLIVVIIGVAYFPGEQFLQGGLPRGGGRRRGRGGCDVGANPQTRCPPRLFKKRGGPRGGGPGGGPAEPRRAAAGVVGAPEPRVCC